MSRSFVLPIALLISTLGWPAGAQDRPRSPRGQAATQLDGHWITVDYGRPILRERNDIFGGGAEYATKVNAGAPVWRAGANQTTRFTTEVDLMFGDQKLAAGEYSLFIDLEGPNQWAFILSNWGAQQTFNREDKENLWGSYGYTPEKDVVRVPMRVGSADLKVDQLTFGFVNGSTEGGALAVWWDQSMAWVEFTF